MTKKFFRSEIGERVEQGDLAHAAYESQLQILRALGTEVLTGETGTVNVVLDGFASADGYGVLPGTVVTIQGGKAVVGHRESGEARLGLVLAGGSTSHNRDMDGMADGTYGVFIRAILVPDSYANRLHWNATEVTPVEVARNIATRVSEEWEIAIELTSPGVEYLQVAQAVKSGGSVTLTDTRPWFYEGLTTNTYAVVDTEWGSTDDRNADRATYGVKTLRRFARAVQRQLQGIIGSGGGTNWWQNPQAGNTNGSGSRSLTQLNDEKLARNGAQTLTGTVLPGTDVTIELGSTSFRFLRVWGQYLRSTRAMLTSAAVTGNVYAGSVSVANEDSVAFAPVPGTETGVAVATTRTFYKFLDAAKFQGTVVPGGPTSWHPFSNSVGLNAVGSDVDFVAQMDLPHGVTLTSMDFQFYNDDPAATLLDVYRQNLSTNAMEHMFVSGQEDPGSLPSPGSGHPDHYVISVAPSVNNELQFNVINNQTYRYLVIVRCAPATITSLRGVHLTYTSTSMRMP